MLPHLNDQLHGAPWVVKTLLMVAPVTLGFFALLAMLLGLIESPLTRVGRSLERLEALQQESLDAHTRQTDLLRTICSNTSETLKQATHDCP